MTTELDVYAFKANVLGRGAGTHVCVADRSRVLGVLSVDEIDRLFFGSLIYRGQDDQPFIGVWGARNAARFRQLLRDGGLVVRIRKTPPPGTLTLATTFGKARADAVR
jgi:hypothetical protein